MKSIIVLTILFTSFAISILGQTASKDLVRADIVINKNKPTVYFCVDLQHEDSDFMWFQLHNNTIWGLIFKSEKEGKSKPFILPDGRNVIALEDKTVSAPLFQFYDVPPNEQYVKFGDSIAVRWLLSGNYTSFKIPRSYLSKRRLIALEYNYQWEIIGEIHPETYELGHRVFTSFDASDFKSNLCGL